MLCREITRRPGERESVLVRSSVSVSAIGSIDCAFSPSTENGSTAMAVTFLMLRLAFDAADGCGGCHRSAAVNGGAAGLVALSPCPESNLPGASPHAPARMMIASPAAIRRAAHRRGGGAVAPDGTIAESAEEAAT